MMCCRMCSLLMLVGGLVVAGGCGQPTRRSNAPPQGHSQYKSELSVFYDRMGDNAAAKDMSVSDIHFKPHSGELNSTGTMKLARMVGSLEDGNAGVRYMTYLDDDEIVDARLASISAFLEVSGVNMTGVTVAKGKHGSNTMRADEAIAAKEKGFQSEFDTGERGFASE